MSTEESDLIRGRLLREYQEANARWRELRLEISSIGGLLVTLGMALQDHRTDVANGFIETSKLSARIDFKKLGALLVEYDDLNRKLAAYRENLGLE